MRPVGHAVTGIVLASMIRLALDQPVPSVGIFIAGIISAVLDLDRTERPPHNTPLGHSILMVGVWNLAGVIIAQLLQEHLDTADIVLGLMVGLWGHLSIDILCHETVFTFPTAASLSKVRSPVPVGADFEELHDGGFAVSAPWATCQRLSGGELGWPYWHRFETRYLRKNKVR